MIKLKDVAKAAGVSPATASNALNGRNNVSKETVAIIQKLCEEMNYSPNITGKYLKTGINNTILFSFSDFDRDYYLKIINGISDFVQSHDYDLMICTSRSCEKFMSGNFTRGCILLDRHMKSEILIKKASADYPIIALDRIVDNPYIKSVVIDNYNSMYEMINKIASNGRKTFAFLGGIESTEDNNERYQAFLDALANNHVEFERKNYISGDYLESSGKRAAQILMLSNRLPEVLVCANDNMAIGAIKVFKKNAIRIPEDIEVTGFDNCNMASQMGLTTAAVPNYERGYLAAQYLIENITGNKSTDVFSIASKVIWRTSTKI
ncbi:MAG: transcriptional regulator, LacI family [Bacillota bacterium]|jgi:LacI family transcriptional regulator|nr:transcriptional regulator, LacI family [Bacillota bacterium]